MIGGQCYRSREEHERIQAAKSAWDKFRRELPYAMPKHLTAEDIAEISKRVYGGGR